MVCSVLEPRRIAVIFPSLPSTSGTFEHDRKYALVRIGNRPTRYCRPAVIHGDSAIAQ
jgi:hypothetical protein